MIQRRRTGFGIIGAILVVFGIGLALVSLKTNADFGADPVCTRALTLETPPREGTTCAIIDGTVSRKYRSHSRRSRESHVIVAVSGGLALDVHLQNDSGSKVYLAATPGASVVVETVNAKPAFIATSAGTVSASADPHLPLIASGIVIVVGGLLVLVAVRSRSSRARS